MSLGGGGDDESWRAGGPTFLAGDVLSKEFSKEAQNKRSRIEGMVGSVLGGKPVNYRVFEMPVPSGMKH